MIISTTQIRKLEELEFDLKAAEHKVKGLPVQALETPDRIALNREYKERKGVPFDMSVVSLGKGFGEERTMGEDNSLFTDYIERQAKVMKAVARVRVKVGGKDAMGTGFMVTPNILLTNNHVIPTAAAAAGGELDFGYEYDAYRREKQPFVFKLDPRIFVTLKELDFTLIGVDPNTVRGEKLLPQFGYLPLNPEPAKVLLKDCVSIIQHPKGGRKRIAFRDNQLIRITDHHLWYVTDTEPGSSGAPAFNDAWEVIGLHRSGVVSQDVKGNYLKTDGTPWDGRSPIEEHELKWIANEAVRVSSIMGAIQDRFYNLPGMQEVLSAHKADPKSTSPVYMSPGKSSKTYKTQESINMEQQPYNIFMPITVVIGNGSAAHAPVPAITAGETIPSRRSTKGGEYPKDTTIISQVPDSTITRSADELLVERFTGNYTGRDGYSPDFLGSNFKVLMPRPEQGREDDLGGILTWGQNNQELPYRHFSVLMSQEWKLAIVTACNVDGKQERPDVSRESNKWFYDARIRKEDHFYDKIKDYYGSKTMNHGHMVRRQDPVWGIEAEEANNDTFHLTNSAPQAGMLNQKRWLDLENHILHQAWNKDERVSVFTAPVLLSSPRNLGRNWFGNYKGTHIPMAFWKVVVYVKDDKLRCASFLMDQVQEVNALELDFGNAKKAEVRESQVSLKTLEKLIGLRFDKALHAKGADAFADVPRLVGQEALTEALGFDAKAIESVEDLVL